MHFDDPGRDVFLPVRAPFGLTPFRIYSARQFLDELSARARKRKKSGDDLIAP